MKTLIDIAVTVLTWLSLGLLITQCSEENCRPNEQFTCIQNATYWIDSCGVLGVEEERCECGCNEDQSDCEECQECIPECTGKCCGDDGCGGDCPDNCAETGQTCNIESCTCEGVCQPMDCAQLDRQCDWWDDGCGTLIGCGDCTDYESCVEGRCVPTSDCLGIPLTSDGLLDLDVKVVQVSGVVTLNGEDLPTEDLGRGSLLFHETNSGTSLDVPLEQEGLFSYSVMLSPGVYRIELGANQSLCDQESPSKMPCNSGVLLEGIVLDLDGVLDLDIPAVQVAGNVTLKDNQMPPESGDRGSLLFQLQDGGSVATKSFENSGSASYELTLLPGLYTVDWTANPALCQADSLPEVPCINGTVLSGVQLTSDGVLDVNIPSIRVQGNVTLKGAQMTQESADRGSLLFQLVDGGSLPTKNFAPSGSVTYGLTLLPGSYNVDLVANPALCLAELDFHSTERNRPRRGLDPLRAPRAPSVRNQFPVYFDGGIG